VFFQNVSWAGTDGRRKIVVRENNKVRGEIIPETPLVHLSRLSWEYINFTGDSVLLVSDAPLRSSPGRLKHHPTR
jgi:hypothetical protein